MEIYWLKEKHLQEIVIEGYREDWLIDIFELEAIFKKYPHLSFGAFENGHLVGFIMGYTHDKTAWISNFLVKQNYRNRGFGKRLFETLLSTLLRDKKTIYLNASLDIVSFYESFGFKEQIDIVRLSYEPQDIKFKFSNKDAKELEKTDFQSMMLRSDKRVFKEDREDFLKDFLYSKSSLRLSTKNGFNHSRVIDSKYVFLGPFEIRDGAYLDLERLLRGVIFHRGFKKIFVDVPDLEHITSLYKNYNFEIVSKNRQMCLGEPIDIIYDDIYGFASARTCG